MNYHQVYYQQHKEQNREYGRKWRKQNPDYHSQYSKEYYQVNGGAIKSAVMEWAENNPEKVVTQNTFKTQIRNGSIIRPESCSVCGNPCVAEGHHKDYTKPLEVMWLCRSCHKRVHARTLSLVR